MKTGRPEYYIPSAETLSRDVKNVFIRVRRHLAKALQVSWALSFYDGLRTHPVTKEYDGKLNFATDSWSSPNHKSYIAMTVHFERAGKLFSMLLDLVEVAESHTGVNLGITFANVLKNFGIEEKVSKLNCDQRRTGGHSPVTWTCVGVSHLQILSITGDNASNNDGMIRYLGETLNNFPSPTNQTRCFVHTINLIAKSILKPFDTRKAKDIQAFNDVAQAIAGVTEGTEQVTGDDDDDERADDEKDKDVDEHEEALDDELSTSLDPIRSMLLKVCLRFVHLDHNPKLTNVECSSGRSRLRSKTQRPSSCQHGTRYFPFMAFPFA